MEGNVVQQSLLFIVKMLGWFVHSLTSPLSFALWKREKIDKNLFYNNKCLVYNFGCWMDVYGCVCVCWCEGSRMRVLYVNVN